MYRNEYEKNDILLFNNKYLYKVLEVRHFDLLNNNWTYLILDLKTKQEVWFCSRDIKNHIIINDEIGGVLYGEVNKRHI